MGKKAEITLEFSLHESNSGLRFKATVKQVVLAAGLVVIFLLFVGAGAGLFFTQVEPTDIASREKRETEDRIKKLGEAIVRVRSYEDQLRLRASLLSELVADVGRLDLDVPRTDSRSGRLTAKGSSGRVSASGVGGGSGLDLIKSGASVSFSPRFDVDNHRGRRLLSLLDSHLETLSHFPVGAPVVGEISSEYGYRKSPFDLRRQFHSGVDIAVERRTQVASVADGWVVTSSRIGGYGLAVVINHGNGLQTLYGHLDELGVVQGTKVCRGQTIGFVGSTGMSTGPHVHYEVRIEGVPQDPAKFIELAGVVAMLGDN